MSSTIAICNLALSNIGKDNINALEEASVEARACRQFYGHVRDTLLQAYPWRFAGKTRSLALVANDRAAEWDYAYSRPTDCLKVRRLHRDRSDAKTAMPDRLAATEYGFPYDIEGETIYCDLSPAFLSYTFRNEDPSRFPPLFSEALSWHLAVRLAMPLTRDPKVRADAYQLAMRTQALAEAADANEVRENSDHESEFVAERG